MDAAADLEKAVRFITNAKTSRPSVCNAEEVCLVHRDVAAQFLPLLKKAIVDDRAAAGLVPVELRLDPAAARSIDVTPAGERDFDTEFLDYILAVGVVDSLAAAIAHVLAHSPHPSAANDTEAAASAALTCAVALGSLTGDALLAAGVAAGIAALWLGPASAAAAAGMGALFGRLATVALSAGGVLGLGDVAAALGDMLFWAAVVLVAATAALTSLLLNAHARRAEQGSNLAAIAAIAGCGIGTAASLCLAHHMEIASLASPDVAKAADARILSSIIVGICLYLLGYQRTYTESDLS